MTQRERVLDASRRFNGTCQADWSGIRPTPDLGRAISRVAARIEELRRHGHSFDVIGTRDKTRVYRLAEERSSVERGATSSSPTDDRTVLLLPSGSVALGRDGIEQGTVLPTGSGADAAVTGAPSVSDRALLDTGDTLFDIEPVSRPHYQEADAA